MLRRGPLPPLAIGEEHALMDDHAPDRDRDLFAPICGEIPDDLNGHAFRATDGDLALASGAARRVSYRHRHWPWDCTQRPPGNWTQPCTSIVPTRIPTAKWPSSVSL
jgi:hypothetical protein